MEAFQNQESTTETKGGLINQEAESIKKAKELAKKREEEMKAVISNKVKEGHIMKGAIKYQDDNKFSQVKSKIMTVRDFWSYNKCLEPIA